MTNPLPKPAVSAVIVENGCILLVKRGCEPNKGLWSLPGGSIEPGETIREAVAREVLEETGLVVEPGGVADVYDVISRDGEALLFHYVIASLYARVVSGVLAAGSDAADARWVPLQDVAGYPVTPHLVRRVRVAMERLAALGLVE